jgi:hypothetical protein
MADVEFTVEAIDKSTSAIKGIRGAILTLNQTVQLAETGYRAVSKAIDETIGEYVKYANQVRQVNQLTGQTSQESSKLIQVLDDYNIGIDNINAANRTFITQGKTMTVETLARLSDQYNSLATATEKNSFMIQNFGRDYQKFLLVMEQGGNAIRKQSDSISANLILTDKAIAKARQWEIAMDDLHDTMQGLKVQVGGALIDPVLLYLKTMEAAIPAAGSLWDYLKDTIHGDTAGAKQDVDAMTASFIPLVKQLQGMLGVAAKWQNAGKGMAGALDEIGKAADEANKHLNLTGGMTSMFDEGRWTMILDGAKSYGDYLSQLSAAEDELATLRKQGWAEHGETVQRVVTKIRDLKQAEQDSINTQIWNDLRQAMGDTDPVVRAVGMAFGFLTQQEIDAYTAAHNIEVALKSLDGKTVTTTMINRIINIVGEQSYTASTPGASVPYSSIDTGTWKGAKKAGGGSFSGWAMVGDAAGGRKTPWTEYVYAPHGAVVYNQSQMSGKSAPPMASGGVIPGMGEVELSDNSIRRLSAALSHDLAPFL